MYSKFLLRVIICGLSTLSTGFIASAKTEKEADRQSYKIYVDKNGVMRRSDTKEEVAYYGTNYTLPFAHAYRATDYLGIDHKKAIDRDVYHMKRLGFNGYRLHLWDVEISDSAGNLLQNDHLDLLDYLIAQLEKNGIDIILTAQTNFGNGYPEKNIDTGAFTYDYDKCEIHSNKNAQEIQANYLTQLAAHVNPYTNRSYSDDNAIIAMEINNEPCHKAPKKEVTEYINKMVKALKKGGFTKPILYNVSHNPDVTSAYYDADIQGTTYQWYPTGLVAGHQRKGNFLPNVSEYPIPWADTIKNYNKMARLVYEFDPGDVLYSHLYPAIARTFRKEGFQWITQFAYDPTDLAKYNTEYQTHFLNLAYTPSKAVSMLIAGEATRNIPRGADFGIYPENNIFGDFLVSYQDDLSLLNSPETYYYSNSTDIQPRNPEELEKIAGVGSSPIIEYPGTGAYFLDKTSQPGVWRLEVMPDIVLTSDPFEKPSLKKEIGKIFYAEHPMKINLPQLGKRIFYKELTPNSGTAGETIDGTIPVRPGVYLLSAEKEDLDKALDNPSFNNEDLRAFVAPAPDESNSIIINNPPKYIDNDNELKITAEIIGAEVPEEVLIYPSTVSFWNDHNHLIPMQRQGDSNIYSATIDKKDLGYGNEFKYNIVVKENGKSFTWPQNIEGTPLDWDFIAYDYYSSSKIGKDDPLVLLSPTSHDSLLEMSMIPDEWSCRIIPELKSPIGKDIYHIYANPENDGKLIIRKYIGDELAGAPFLTDKKELVVKLSQEDGSEGTIVSLVGKNGSTYSATLTREYMLPVPVKMHQDEPNEVYFTIPLEKLIQTPTHIVPTPFPSFLPREAITAEQPFNIDEIDFLEFSIPTQKGKKTEISLEGVWLQ